MNKKTVFDKLKELGIDYNETAQGIIKKCDDWYKGKQTDFHSRTNVNGITTEIPTINFAKRCCADDANLCELIEINSCEENADFEAVNNILKGNRFSKMYRKQLEQLCASGTVGAYISLKNVKGEENADGSGKITHADVKINYCEADNIIPITVDNGDVTECAFMGTNLVGGVKEDVLVVFRIDENGKYYADSYYFIDSNEDESRKKHLPLDTVKPFAIMHTAEVNNLDNMDGYGYPKIYTSIPVLECLDLAFYILHGDLDKGEKLVFINELLACIKTVNGQPTLTPEQKKLFVLLGEKLPDQQDIVKEYNPEIRIDAITKIIETLLSILSMSFGFGTKKYTFENGQIKTASEYIGERQDCMQELNKQRGEAKDYITAIVTAVKWFSNVYSQTAFNLDEEIAIDFDDSYIEDKGARLERLREDAQLFGIEKLTIWYIMEAYNLSEEEATDLVRGTEEKKAQEETDDANDGEEE